MTTDGDGLAKEHLGPRDYAARLSCDADHTGPRQRRFGETQRQYRTGPVARVRAGSSTIAGSMTRSASSTAMAAETRLRPARCCASNCTSGSRRVDASVRTAHDRAPTGRGARRGRSVRSRPTSRLARMPRSDRRRAALPQAVDQGPELFATELVVVHRRPRLGEPVFQSFIHIGGWQAPQAAGPPARSHEICVTPSRADRRAPARACCPDPLLYRFLARPGLDRALLGRLRRRLGRVQCGPGVSPGDRDPVSRAAGGDLLGHRGPDLL
jgi:hypothetical protein